MLPYATGYYKEIKNILEHGISAFYFRIFEFSLVSTRKCGKENKEFLCPKVVCLIHPFTQESRRRLCLLIPFYLVSVKITFSAISAVSAFSIWPIKSEMLSYWSKANLDKKTFLLKFLII